MSRLLTQEEFEKSINENIIPLEKYKGGKHRIKVKCKICNHEWTPYGKKLLEGSGCPNCNILSKRKSNEDFINELKEINDNIEPLEEYVLTNKKILFRCKIDGYEWRTMPTKVLGGKGCPCCAGNARRTIDEIRKILEDKNITLLSTEYKNIHSKISVKCNKCEYEWDTEPNVLLNHPCGCPKCYGNIKKTHDEFVQELNQINDKLKVLTEYLGANENITCECLECGYTYDTTPHSLLSGHGCKYCNHTLTEKVVKDIFTNRNIEFTFQKTFDELIGVGGRKLSYDFYLPKYNMLLEIQGQQHYYPVDFGGKGIDFATKQFERQKIHDVLKKEYAQKNKYELFEIPYWEFDNIGQILESRLLLQSA